MRLFKVCFWLLFIKLCFSQTSLNVLQNQDNYYDNELMELNVESPLSGQVNCRASVTKQKPDGSYYMVAFATDVLRHIVLSVDVADENAEKISVFGNIGEGNGEFHNPMGAAADQFGNVYIVDMGNNRIVKLHYDFEMGVLSFVQNIESNFNEPYDVSISTMGTPENATDDRIWIADNGNHRIVELYNDGTYSREYGSEGSSNWMFQFPTTLKVYSADTQGNTKLVIGDAGNSRLINMSTNNEWYELPLTAGDMIVSVDIYDEEIYALEKYSGQVHKIRWPNMYLCATGGFDYKTGEDNNSFHFPNSISIPFPEQMPYICVFEQFTNASGAQLTLQGLDMFEMDHTANVNGSAAVVDYRFPTNGQVQEVIVDENGNVIKTLTNDIIVDSDSSIAATWYCDDENGDQVPGGTYYYQANVVPKWEYDDSGVPIGKKVMNKVLGVNSEGVEGEIERSVRIDIPITTTYIPPAFTGYDMTLKNTIEWGETREDTSTTGRAIGVGYYYDYVHRITRAILKFDMTQSGLTKRDLVDEASLMLLTAGIDNDEGNTKLSVYKILVPWIPGECCWNRPYTGGPEWNGADPATPYVSTEPVDYIYRNEQTGWYEWAGEGMRDLVQDWLENPVTNYGVVIKIDDDSGYKDWQCNFAFYSNDPDPVWYDYKMPRLEIVYKKNANIPVFKAEIIADIKQGTVPFTVKFDASNSFSPSGIKTYSWDMDTEDGVVEEDTTGKVLEYTFMKPGKDYLVTLTTIDSANIRGYDTLTVKTNPFYQGVYAFINPLDTNEKFHWWVENKSDMANIDSVIVENANFDRVVNGMNGKIRVEPDLGGNDDGITSSWLKFIAINSAGLLPEESDNHSYHCDIDGPEGWEDNLYFTAYFNNSTSMAGYGTADEWGKIVFHETQIDTFDYYADPLQKGINNGKDLSIPDHFYLNQNYPNPFNPVTTIAYGLPEESDVLIHIYNMLGQRITTLLDERQNAGNHIIQWTGVNDNGVRVTSGIYLVRIQAKSFIKVKKMVMLK